MLAIERFLRQTWRLFAAQQAVFAGSPGSGTLPPNASAELKELHFVRHRTIAQVTKDVENFEFNTALSRLMEFVNQLYQYTAQPAEKQDAAYLRPAFEDLLLLLAPLAPHLGEEMWEATGHTGTVFNAPWPTHDPAALKRDEVELAIQVNGKVREQFTVPSDMAENELKERAAAYGKIPSLLEGKTVVKIVVVKGRLVNIVVK